MVEILFIESQGAKVKVNTVSTSVGTPLSVVGL
jgi:hypothetical protein